MLAFRTMAVTAGVITVLGKITGVAVHKLSAQRRGTTDAVPKAHNALSNVDCYGPITVATEAPAYPLPVDEWHRRAGESGSRRP